MASKAPPIPPAQRSSPGDRARIQGGDARRQASARDQGRAGPQQNTHHSHQQDR